jgi:ABC-type nickel/cobalt efflux system permease component RcnA
MLYDPQKHDLLDVFMVEDYEEGHVGFVSRLLDYIHQNGKPQAIHCFGERSFPLLSALGKQMGIRIMQGTFNQELENLKEFFVLQGQEQSNEGHENHEHVHDQNCGHHHTS